MLLIDDRLLKIGMARIIDGYSNNTQVGLWRRAKILTHLVIHVE